ncbi:MAG: hypothetical protein PVJ04_05850 [Gemmatimonadota bacterium]
MAATPFAREDAWASRAAVLMAREWANEGLRVFLMDLGLEEPSLHDVLDLPNGEGVSEAFLFGASVQHIAKPALNNAIFFASAGAPPGDPEEVLGHPRWNDLAGGFSEAEATLLLFLPTDIPGAGKILSRATDIVFLAGRGESAETHLGPASIKVVTTLGPLGTPSGDATAPEGSVSSLPPLHEPGANDGESRVAEEPGEDTGLGPLTPDFDFEGALELAEGFRFAPEEEVDSQGAEAEGEEAVASSDAPLAEPALTGTTSGREEDIPEPGREVEEEVSLSEAREGEPGFGDDLQMGASLSEALGEEVEEAGEGEEVRSRAPDFEAHFVDLPPAGGEEPSWAGEDEFGQDLVQGPDFGAAGGPLPEEGEARIEPPEEVPAPSSPPDRAKEVLVPERRRPPRKKPPKKKIPWGRIGAVLVAVAILGSAVGTATGYLDVPGFGFLRSFFAEIPDPPLTLAGPQANEEVLRYSLVLFEYDEAELDDGLEMLDALQARLPHLLLTLVPGEVNGERIYTLLAGPAVDRVEAENLRAPIAEVLVREDPASWSVRETPRAFYLGERGTLEEARAYLESVAPDDLHAYILHVTFPEPEGSESYQILTGAFAGIPDARPLQLILRDLGFRDAPLIERRGRLPE